MKPQYHVASSVLLASILYLFFKSWSMSISCVFSGIFIDLDHIYDYIREIGYPFKFRDMVQIALNNDITRWTVVLHSWELLFVLLIIAWYTNWNPWITGTLIGFTSHILLDTVNQGITFQPYSFIWRRKRNYELPIRKKHKLKPVCLEVGDDK
jgi:hypothetical protein